MDKNGYVPSIVQNDMEACAICYRGGDLARHEIFNGPFRQKSKRLGLWVALCPQCHAEIHSDIIRRKALKRWGQKCAMNYYIWSEDEFRREFGKSYLEE